MDIGKVANVSKYHGLHQPNAIPSPKRINGIMAKKPMKKIISLVFRVEC